MAAIYGEERVNYYTNDHQYGAQVALLADGSYVVSWVSRGQDGSDDGIYAQRYNSVGMPVGAGLGLGLGLRFSCLELCLGLRCNRFGYTPGIGIFWLELPILDQGHHHFENDGTGVAGECCHSVL